MDNSEYRLCPFCSEEIKIKAVKCRYCQTILDEESVAEIERVRKNLFSGSTEQAEAPDDAFEEIVEDIPEKIIAEEKELNWDNGIYSGGIKNGKLHGQGVMIIPDGHRFEGEWSEGKKHGEGVLIYPEGIKIIGRWIDDRFIEEETNYNDAKIESYSEPEEERFYPDEEVIKPLKTDEPVKVEQTVKQVANPGDDLIDCPHCSGKILAYAIKCKHCGSMIQNF